MAQTLFDLDVLRSFSTGIAMGSYARAADRLGRSTSAVSAQLKKLESQAGTALFRKAGRGLALTDAGETMLAYAHRLLALNEEAAAAMRGAGLEGSVRLGLSEDFGEVLLPEVLGRFARAHPRVRVEACVARSGVLRERMTLGELDLAIALHVGGEPISPNAERIGRLPLQWIGPPLPDTQDAPWWHERMHRAPGARRTREPLPLVLLEPPCPLREIVVGALDRAGQPWRHAFSSGSLTALWAATAAGLGLTVRTAFGVPAHLRTIERGLLGLPALPPAWLTLYRAAPQAEAPVERLAALLREAVCAAIGVQQ